MIELASEVGTGWTGSVRITSDAGIAAVAARHKMSTDMILMNTSAPSRADDEAGYRLSAPLVYVDYFGWNTGISIANESSNANHIEDEVSFYDEDGELVAEISETIDGDGHGHDYIYLPGEVVGEPDLRTGRPLETLELVFDQITVTYTPMNPDGTPGISVIGSWNVGANRP